MKNLLFVLLLNFGILLMAQKNYYDKIWQEIEQQETEGLLKQTLPKVDEIYKKAKKKGETKQLIRALLYQSKIALITSDEVEDKLQVVNRFEEEIKTAKTVEEKAILQSMLADMLWQYYQNNQYRIRQRTKTEEKLSNDFRTWSSNHFLETCEVLYKQSVEDENQLINNNLNDWTELLLENKKHRNVSPTLYDLLAHRAIDFYKNHNSRNYYSERENVDEQFDENAKKLYQNLIKLHQTKGNKEAELYNQLELLVFENKNDKNDDGYIEALERLSKKYPKVDYSAQVKYILAQLYQTKANDLKKEDFKGKKSWLDKALTLVDEIEKQYPETIGAYNAAKIKEQILEKELGIQIENYLVPNQISPMYISQKNVDKIFVKIFQSNRDLSEIRNGQRLLEDKSQEELDKLLKRYPLVKEFNLNLNTFNDYQTHSTIVKLDALKTGEYLIIASNNPDFKIGEDTEFKYQFVNVTAYAPVARAINNKKEVYLTDRQTGVSLANQNIKVYELNYRDKVRQKKSLTTDKNGMGSYSYSDRSYQEYFQVNDEPVYITVNRTYNYDYERDSEIKIEILTDRAIYRPGQVVHFKLIAYAVDFKKNKSDVVPNIKDILYLNDPNGNEVGKFEFTTNKYGSASGQFVLPTGSITGRFRFEVEENFWDSKSLENEKYDDYNFNDSYHSILVEEYKRPKFEVEFDKVTETFKLEQEVTANGKAQSFAGANIDNAKVVYRVYRQAVYPYLPWWVRSSGDYGYEPEEEITHGETTTDNEGKFVIKFSAKPAKEKSDQPRTYNYRVVADITDINGETHTASQSITVGDLEYVLKFKNPETIELSDFDSIQLETNNLNGEFVPVKGTLKLSKLKAPNRILRTDAFPETTYQLYPKAEFINYFPNDDYDGESEPQNREKELVFERTFNTEQDKNVAINAKKFKPGYYMLEGFIPVGKDTIEAKHLLYLYAANSSKPVDNERFNIELTKHKLEPNESTELILSSAGKNTNVWVEIEHKGNIIRQEKVVLNASTKTISIPIKEEYRGGIQVKYYTNQYNRADFGNFNIHVPFTNKQLKITASTLRNKLLPGQEETWELTVAGQDKEKLTAEVLAMMYDASLDQFTPHNIDFFPYSYTNYSMFSNWNPGSNFRTNYFDNLPYHYQYNYFTPKSYVFEQLNWFGFDLNNPVYKNNEFIQGLNFLQKSKDIEGKVSGIVVDSDGFPDEGATVMLKGTNISILTNEDGEFVIDVKKGSGVLVIQPSDGSELWETLITSQNLGEINPHNQVSLDEIVVSGYAKAKRSASNDVAYAMEVASAESEDIPLNAAPPPPADSPPPPPPPPGEQEKKADLTKVQARKNLQETAFFFPQLMTDKNGNIKFSFTTPEALTEWNFMALAHTPDLKTANFTAQVQTQKDLMVVPNAPRFLRQGDEIQFTSKVVNLSDNQLNGSAQLLLFDAFTMEEVDAAFSNQNSTKNFTVTKGKSENLTWTLKIPDEHQAVVYRVVASAGDFSDGEESALPILTNRMLVTETMPIHIREGQEKTFTFQKLKSNQSKTLKNNKLTLEMTTNPIWYAIFSLPYLREYPYECSEQIFSRFYGNVISQNIINSNPKIKAVFDDWNKNNQLISPLEKNQELKSLLLEETPWVRHAQSEAEQQKRIAVLFDLNTMRNELQATFRKLEQRQYSSGGFPWFDGGRESRYITTHILAGMGHLKEMGIDFQTDLNVNTIHMIRKMTKYLDNEMEKDYKEFLKDKKRYKISKNNAIQYLYARSYFKDELPIKNKAMFDEVYSVATTDDLKNELQTKAMLALIYHRYKKAERAKALLTSIKDYAVDSDEMGMYWKENKPGWYWYNAPIETQALLIEAFDEVLNDTESVESMKVWLLKNRQTNRWQTTKATTEAVYALMNTGKDWTNAEEGVTVKVGGETIDVNQLETKPQQGSGYFKTTWSGEEIKPKLASVAVEKTSPGVAWGAMYWQYFEDLDKITFAETNVQMKKELFLQKNTDDGPVLKRITPETPIQVGDLVKIRLEIQTDRDMEFIHIKDMRASGFEPVNVLSGYKWQDGLGYYESTRDAATNFFIDRMRKGIYVFEYELRANNAGNFSNGITTLQNMYAPEFTTHSEGIRVGIE